MSASHSYSPIPERNDKLKSEIINPTLAETDIALLCSLIRVYPSFPSVGIQFRDIFPIFSNYEAINALNRLLLQSIHSNHSSNKVTHICALESRGFLLGVSLAQSLQCAFIPIRKKGKLPGSCISIEYGKEYGFDQIEMQCDVIGTNSICIIVDDLLATGGTAAAACRLIEKLNNGTKVIEVLTLIELVSLRGREKIKEIDSNIEVKSIIQYED